MEGSTNKRTDCNSQVGFGGKRCTFAILAFFALFVSSMNCVDLSVAIVAMVRKGEGKIISFLMKIGSGCKL